MDSQANQSFSDDQELAKVLAGVSQDTDNNLQFEETNATASPVINPATISPDPIATESEVCRSYSRIYCSRASYANSSSQHTSSSCSRRPCA